MAKARKVPCPVCGKALHPKSINRHLKSMSWIDRAHKDHLKGTPAPAPRQRPGSGPPSGAPERPYIERRLGQPVTATPVGAPPPVTATRAGAPSPPLPPGASRQLLFTPPPTVGTGGSVSPPLPPEVLTSTPASGELAAFRFQTPPGGYAYPTAIQPQVPGTVPGRPIHPDEPAPGYESMLEWFVDFSFLVAEGDLEKMKKPTKDDYIKFAKYLRNRKGQDLDPNIVGAIVGSKIVITIIANMIKGVMKAVEKWKAKAAAREAEELERKKAKEGAAVSGAEPSKG